jgi:hypothetical protein
MSVSVVDKRSAAGGESVYRPYSTGGHSKIKAIFDEHCANLRFDRALARRLHAFSTGFVNKNRDHIEFFGGVLTGVHVVRFLDTDKHHWFDDVLDGADEEELREKIHVLPVVNGANGVFQVSGDPMNLSCVWLLHKLHNAKELTVSERYQAMMDVLFVLQTKFLTSRLFRHFKYPIDKPKAEATYAQLTNKFSIKNEGSWIKVLNSRSEDVLSNSGIHFETISKMDNDVMIVRMLNDIQGRIRDMLKNIYAVFLKVHQEGSRISSTSSVVEHDGVEVLKDRVRGLANYTRYLKSVISDKNSFIRDELMSVVQKIVPNAPPKHIRATLEYMSANYLKSATDPVDKLLDAVMVHSFGYLSANRSSMSSAVDLAGLLSRLKGVYTYSRSTDPELMKLRHDTEAIVRRAVETKTEAVIASVRTAVLLYLVSRTYTMQHYTSAA